MGLNIKIENIFDSSQIKTTGEEVITTRGIRYEAVLEHKGLMKIRFISSTNPEITKQKVSAQIRVWDEIWKKQVEKNQEAQKKEKLRSDKEEMKVLATRKTDEALVLQRIIFIDKRNDIMYYRYCQGA